MKCPKCNSSIGIQYAKHPVQIYTEAHGIHCYICGYWKHVIPPPHAMERIEPAALKPRPISV